MRPRVWSRRSSTRDCRMPAAIGICPPCATAMWSRSSALSCRHAPSCWPPCKGAGNGPEPCWEPPMRRRHCLALTLAAPAFAQAPRRYTIGVEDYENFLPYSEFKNGVYRGLGRDLLDAFAKEQGFEFDYVVL